MTDFQPPPPLQPPPPPPPQAAVTPRAAPTPSESPRLIERAEAIISTKVEEIEVLRGLLAENERLRAEVQRLQPAGQQHDILEAASHASSSDAHSTPSPTEPGGGARSRPKKDSAAKFASRRQREWALDPRKVQPAHWVNLLPRGDGEK